MPLKPLDLTRTRQAVEAYDRRREYLLQVEAAADDERWAEEERLAKAVGEAFALDTADRNDPATARLIRPGDPWLRALLAKYAEAPQSTSLAEAKFYAARRGPRHLQPAPPRVQAGRGRVLRRAQRPGNHHHEVSANPSREGFSQCPPFCAPARSP